jgi:hypothetical protein
MRTGEIMDKWLEFILGKPYESELRDPAALVFALVGGLTGIFVAWPFLGARLADTLMRSGFTLWAAVPVELAALGGALLGLAFGKVVDRKASDRTRLFILRCRQTFFLIASSVGIVYCSIYLYSNSIIFFGVCGSMVLLAFSQTRWRLRPGVLRSSSRNTS